MHSKSLIIKPVRKRQTKTKRISKDPKMQKIFEEIIKKYNSVLKKLGKT